MNFVMEWPDFKFLSFFLCFSDFSCITKLCFFNWEIAHRYNLQKHALPFSINHGCSVSHSSLYFLALVTDFFTFVPIMGSNAISFYLQSKNSTIKKLVKTEIVFK